MPTSGGLEKKQGKKKAENWPQLCLICRLHPKRHPQGQNTTQRGQRLRGLQDNAKAGVVSGLGKIPKETGGES